jgi:hypothetical protein
MLMEVVEGDREPCFTVDTWVEDGFVQIGDTPGLGVTIDEARLAEIEIDPGKPGPAGGMPWGRREGAGLVGVPLTEAERAVLSR